MRAKSVCRVSAGRPRGLQGFGQLLLGLAGLSGVEQIHGESLVRVQEVRIDLERLAVLDDRVVEAAHLQKKLGVGIVRIRVPGKELDVFLERLLRARVVSALPVGVAEQVVGVRVIRGELCGLLVVLDRGRVLLLPEVVAGEVEMGSLVVGIGGHELFQIVLLFRRVGGRCGLVREDQELFPVGRLVGERHGLVQVIEKLLTALRGIGERELGPREVRVERYRLLKVRPRVGVERLLVHVAPLQKLRLRFRRGGRHGDLPAADRRRRLCLGRPGRCCLLLRASAGRHPGGDSQDPEQSQRSSGSHTSLLP